MADLDSPSAASQSTSRIMRMDNLFAGTGPPCSRGTQGAQVTASRLGYPAPLNSSHQAWPLPSESGGQFNRNPLSTEPGELQNQAAARGRGLTADTTFLT